MLIHFKLIKELAESIGLSIISASNINEVNEELEYLENWQKLSYYADMQYMSRPANLFVNTNNFLKDAKSIISVVINYSAKKVDDICPKGYGRVARYAWGKDYHVVLKNKLEELYKLNAYRGELSYSLSSYTFTDFMTEDLQLNVLMQDYNKMPEDLIKNFPDGGKYFIAHSQAPTTSSNNIHPAVFGRTMLWHNGIIKQKNI
jgi:hypothetical protein